MGMQLEKTKRTKTMSKKVFLAVALMAMMGGATMAQTAFTFKLGGGFPTGDFADGNENKWGLLTKDEEGGAGMGFNLGAEWRFEMPSVPNLGIVLSIDGFYNGLSEDINDLFDDLVDEAEDEDVDISLTRPSYLNFPVMVGANYRFEVSPGMILFGTVAAGANLRIITPLKMEEEYDYYSDYYGTTVHSEYSRTYSWKSAVSLGFRLAAGVLFNEKYSIELGYYNLGAGKVKAELEVEQYNSIDGRNSGSDKTTLKSITPEMFTVRFGIAF